MRFAVVVALGLALAGCKKGGAPAAEAPAAEDDGCGTITDLKGVMQCELAPYLNGRKTDEAAFRKALEQLRDLAPSDAAFFAADKPWPGIVQTMLDGRDYKAGCSDCHRHYQKLYRQRFEGSQIPWTDVHGASAQK